MNPKVIVGFTLGVFVSGVVGCGPPVRPAEVPSNTLATASLAGAEVVAASGTTVPADLLAEVARTADRGRRSVDAVWGSNWARSVTVVVGTREDVEEVLGPTTGLPAAAVTWRPAGSAPSAAAQVLIDEAVWRSLPASAQQVVLTHELVHVATGSVESQAPRWLEEGLADYIAWTGTTVPVQTAAREALEAIARTGPPQALPADSDFELGGLSAGAAYGEAYVAARLIAQTYGVDALLEIYRGSSADLARPPESAGSPTAIEVEAALEKAVRVATGAGLDDLVRAWQAELARLASTTP